MEDICREKGNGRRQKHGRRVRFKTHVISRLFLGMIGRRDEEVEVEVEEEAATILKMSAILITENDEKLLLPKHNPPKFMVQT